MDIFSFIKSQVDILSVAQQYTTLKKTGLYWKGACPFHQEKTGSFTVSPHKGIFYCFGCSIGGDVIRFIEQAENCNSVDAVKMLADRYNLTLPEMAFDKEKKSSVVTKSAKEQYLAVCALFSEWSSKEFADNQSIQQYVISRNISSEFAARFNLGYFPSSGLKKFVSYALKKNLFVKDLIDAHIIGKNAHGIYSSFENRLLFPIKDSMGRVCGFGGRVILDSDERVKYVNSKESDFFLKRNLLFGLDVAKQSIQKTTQVFLVEGYTDCIAMHQYGYTNTVATLGTSCSVDHLTLLSRYAETVFIAYDGDKAGVQAILRLATMCWNSSLDLKVIMLPADHDPASYLQAYNSLDKVIQSSIDIFDFFLDNNAKNFYQKSFKQKLISVKKVVEIIKEVNDNLKQNILLQQASKVFGLPFESLRSELYQLKRTYQKSIHTKIGLHQVEKNKEEAGPKAIDINHIGLLEKRLFFAIIQNSQMMTEDNKEYILACLPDVFGSIIKLYKNNQSDSSPSTCLQKLSPDHQKIVSEILVSFENPVCQDEFDKILHQLQKKYWKQITKNIQVQVTQAKLSGDKKLVDSLLQRFITLKQSIAKGLS